MAVNVLVLLSLSHSASLGANERLSSDTERIWISPLFVATWSSNSGEDKAKIGVQVAEYGFSFIIIDYYLDLQFISLHFFIHLYYLLPSKGS